MVRVASGSWAVVVVLLFFGTACASAGPSPAATETPRAAQRPRPPAQEVLERLLVERYPAQARAQSRNGVAKVRVSIASTGEVSHLTVLEETGAFGFGRACIETLQGAGRWQPEIDASGKPVATEVVFKCAFIVDDCPRPPLGRSLPESREPQSHDRSAVQLIEYMDADGQRIGVEAAPQSTTRPASESLHIVTLSFRIETDGSVGDMQVVEGSQDPALGDECRKLTSALGPFQPAVDAECQPIATVLRITCSFEVERGP